MRDLFIPAFLAVMIVVLILWAREARRQTRVYRETLAREQARRDGFETFLRTVREHIRRNARQRG